MILQALYDLALRESLMDDADYEVKPVAFHVRVGQDGGLLGLVPTSYTPEPEEGSRRKPKPRAKNLPIPREPTRTSGDRANFLVDKAEYALGSDPAGKRPKKKLDNRFRLFRERVEECLEATGDAGTRAVSRFLARLADGEIANPLPEEAATNDLFAFFYEEEPEPVHRRPAVRRYWKQQRLAEEGDTRLPCLLTGEVCTPARLHPQLKNVPGGSTAGIALVSFNAAAFESYGWSGNDNAPISREASEAFSAALNRLLHPSPPHPTRPGTTLPRRNLRLSADTVLCYWSAEEESEERGFAAAFGGLMEANPDAVPALFHSIWKGRPAELPEEAPFYALVLTGTQGRAILRGWLEMPVREAQANLARHFADLEIVRSTPVKKGDDRPPAFPLRDLLRSLAPLGDEKRVPSHVTEQLIQAALTGAPYPRGVLQQAVQRTRAEITRDDWFARVGFDARAALIKAVLNRDARRQASSQPSSRQEITVTLDPTNTQDGYLLGRLMAVVERAQELALGSVNASVVDRYFGAASATPGTVFPRLLRGFRHHLRKAKDDGKSEGTARWLDAQADRILAGLDPKLEKDESAWRAFPRFLPLDQQGLFILGYHHQRHFFFMPKEEKAAWRERYAQDAEEPEAETLEGDVDAPAEAD